MIYHRDKLELTPDLIESAVLTLHKAIWPHDVFVVATNENHIERMERMESVAKCKFSKPSWIKNINKNEAVIFTITSGMFRRKNDRAIMAALDYTKGEHEGLTIDVIDGPKFSIFYFAIKNKKSKENDEPETLETTDENK